MSIKTTIQIGEGCNITLDADNPVDLIKKASQFTQLPTKCGHCESKDLGFMHRTAGDSGEYDYLHMKCGACGAQADIGQLKKPEGAIFFKHQPKDKTNLKDGFYKFWEQNNAGGGSSNSVPTVDDGTGDDGGDIPF